MYLGTGPPYSSCCFSGMTLARVCPWAWRHCAKSLPNDSFLPNFSCFKILLLTQKFISFSSLSHSFYSPFDSLFHHFFSLKFFKFFVSHFLFAFSPFFSVFFFQHPHTYIHYAHWYNNLKQDYMEGGCSWRKIHSTSSSLGSSSIGFNLCPFALNTWSLVGP